MTRLCASNTLNINITFESLWIGPFGLIEDYLVFASATLAIMGAMAVGLAVLFRMRFNRLTSLSKDSAANVFNKTFVVFDPYSRITIFHRFLSVLPFVPLAVGFGVAALLFVIMSSGLLLTLLVVIVSLSLMVVEEMPEAYSESKVLINAIESGSSLGVGDVKLLQLTKKLLPRLSSYYLCLSVFLFFLAAILPTVWTSMVWDLAMFFGLIIQVSVSAGPTSWLAAMALYALAVTGFFALATMAKNRIFRFRKE